MMHDQVVHTYAKYAALYPSKLAILLLHTV